MTPHLDKKEDIFLAVLEDHKGIIYKVAYNYCKNPSEREDLVQDIILQIWRSIDSFTHQVKWSTWVYRVSLNTAISYYRKQRKRKEVTVPYSPLIEINDEEKVTHDNEQFQLLTELIQELKEIDRAVILLHLDGLATKEIANVLETTQTNITTKLSRIKSRLKSKLSQLKTQ